jgi:LAO/AO transport system kinase
MSRYVPSSELVERARGGDTQAMARLMSRAESSVEEARPALADIYRQAGRAHVIGVTGVPGSGKSTLVTTLGMRLRASGAKVGVIAVDPSSPYSGGSILGDRVRMTELANDPGVFVRSMATRGAMGGLARAALEAADILDFAGFDTVIIETVGVGQDEVEIAKASNTTVVVSAPGLGDEIQAIKAGMLEIADIHVVSKADRSDANRTLTDIKQMLTMGLTGKPRPWQAPVLGVSSYTGEGFDDFMGALDRHRMFASSADGGDARRREIAEFRLLKTAQNLMIERFVRSAGPRSAPITERLRRREAGPYELAAELLASIGPES